MPDKEKTALAAYRIDKAKECLRAANFLLEAEGVYGNIKQSLLCNISCCQSNFCAWGRGQKKHSGVISYFQQNYVKTGLFDREFSSIVQEAFEVRQESHYEDFYIISKEDAIKQYENAGKFVSAAEDFIQKNM